MWMEGCGLPVKSFFLKKNFLLTQQGWCGCTLISTGYLHLESSRNQAAATLWAEGQTVGSIYLGKKILLKKLHSFKHLIFLNIYICIYVYMCLCEFMSYVWWCPWSHKRIPYLPELQMVMSLPLSPIWLLGTEAGSSSSPHPWAPLFYLYKCDYYVKGFVLVEWDSICFFLSPSYCTKFILSFIQVIA